ESKFDILSKLPADCVIRSALIGSGGVPERLTQLQAHIESAGWRFPLVMKPDVGQRGAGVKLAHSPDAVSDYFSQVANPVVVQPYHAGPFEAGVFYYRRPGCVAGQI